jgi:uncharacterized membrane protein
MRRRLAGLALAILGMGTMGTPLTAAAQVRKQFGSWVAICQSDATGYCSANAHLGKGTEGERSYAYQLHVWRAGAGEPLQITFLASRARPADDSPLNIRVDRGQPLTVEAGSGYQAIRSSNAYALRDRRAIGVLLTQMHGGQRMELRYTDTGGRPAVATFLLNGFSQALGLFEKYSPEIGAARSQAARPTEDTEPAERRKPKPARGRKETPSDTAAAQPAPATEPFAPAPRAGPPPKKARGPSLRQFACRGNEPFWTLLIDRDQAAFSMVGREPESQQFAGKFRIAGEGRTPIVQWKGKAPGVAGELVAVLAEERCADTMAGAEGQTEFAFRAQVTEPGGRKLQGCCRAGLEGAGTPAASELATAPVADFAAKREEDWARHLPDLHPAIRACLEKTPGHSPYVTKAWPMNQGMVGVRTRSGDGDWFHCIAQSDGRAVDRFDSLPRTEPPAPGENLVLFTPAGQAPRPGNCWEHERVLGDAKKLVGYLSYNIC